MTEVPDRLEHEHVRTATPPLEINSPRPGVVSVVVPCYRYARYLTGCVKSILEEQGDVPVEVIIVDDCSPDDTEVIGRTLEAADSRVIYMRNDLNLGHIATYNRGLSRATGEFLVLLSADDFLAPGSLIRAVSVLSSDPEIAFVYGRCARTASSATDVDVRAFATKDARFRICVEEGRRWADGVCRAAENVIPSAAVVARGDVHRRMGGYRPDLPHTGDLEMWLRLATQGRVASISGPAQAVARDHGSNMSAGYTKVADLVQVAEAFAVYQAYADLAWPGKAAVFPAVQRELACRAVRRGLDTIGRVKGVEGRRIASELLDFARAGDPLVVRHPSFQLLKQALAGRLLALAVTRGRGVARGTLCRAKRYVRWAWAGDPRFRRLRQVSRILVG